MNRNALAFAVLLPLLVLVLGIVRAERRLARSQRWLFDVAGYDPRDLLRGHYINYRIAFDEGAALKNCADDTGERCCLCLHATASGVPPKVQRASCATAKQQCEGVLQTRYLSELRRYYIPESQAAKLTQRFQSAANDKRARLLLAIDPQGKPAVDALLIDGQRIEAAQPTP